MKVTGEKELVTHTLNTFLNSPSIWSSWSCHQWRGAEISKFLAYCLTTNICWIQRRHFKLCWDWSKGKTKMSSFLSALFFCEGTRNTFQDWKNGIAHLKDECCSGRGEHISGRLIQLIYVPRNPQPFVLMCEASPLYSILNSGWKMTAIAVSSEDIFTVQYMDWV